MTDIVKIPATLCRIPNEIDKHGKNIASEIELMSTIIDEHGDNINKNMNFHGDSMQKEMQLMRETFEREMKDLSRKTRNTVVAVVAVNVLSRFLFR
jgi:formyltetrahydrofolate hydrolase